MIRIKRAHLRAGMLAIAAIIGSGLGYVQDNVTQRILPEVFPLFVIGTVGWFAYMIWNLAALEIPRLRLQSLEATKQSLMLVVIFWVATVIGGVSFFLINSTDSETLWYALSISIFMATAYNFVVLIIPLLLLRLASSPAHNNKMGREE